MSHKAHPLKTGALHVWKYEKIRFAVVGAVNTLVDFIIFLILAKLAGVPTIAANVISTGSALGISYLLNKKAVFGNANKGDRQQITQFIIVTLVGLWVLQAIVITLMVSLLHIFVPHMASIIVLIIAKAAATIASLTWNYLWYSRVVFRKAGR